MKYVINYFWVALACFLIGWFARGFFNSNQVLQPAITSIPHAEIMADSAQATTARENIFSVSEKPLPSNLEIFRHLLKILAFDKAIQLFEDVHASDEIQAKALHLELLVYLQHAMEHGQNDNFMALVDGYLSRYYDDIDVLIMLAEYQSAQGYPDEAVRVLQTAFVYAYQPVKRKRVSDALSMLVEKTDELLTQQERWNELLGFYQLMESIDMGRPEYQFRQAVLYLEQGDTLMARDLLLSLKDNIQLNARVAELLAVIEKQSGTVADQLAEAESIPLIRRGNHYLIKVMLNDISEVTLMVDTGASITSISESSFLALSQRSNYPGLGARLFNTANGVTKGQVYLASQFGLGDNILNNISLAVLKYQQGSEIDGLLGMNDLQNFRFEIVQDKEVLYLQAR